MVVAITVMGTCEVAPVLRSGARPGDVVALAGRQGWAAAGLAVLGRGFRSPRVLVEAYQRPEPPYAAGAAAARAGATAMIDVSDGLLADAGHIAADSGVAIDIDRSAFELADPMRAVGSALGVDPMQFILGGGDDHAILATFPAGTDPARGLHGDRLGRRRGGRRSSSRSTARRTTGPGAGRTSEPPTVTGTTTNAPDRKSRGRSRFAQCVSG